jgi:hypothetical protein
MYGLSRYSGNKTEVIGTDGKGYNKFENKESNSYIPSYTELVYVSKRVAYSESGDAAWYWCRSIMVTNTSEAAYINSTGSTRPGVSVSYQEPFYEFAGGICFGFCIDSIVDQ